MHGMSDGTLRYRLSLEKEGKEFVGSGRRPALTPEQETELANVISVLSRIGFSPSRNDVFGPKETLKKDTFVDLLCSIWHRGLSKENAISGFRTTGIYPTDSSKYPIARFDACILRSYKKWDELGRPDDFDFENLPDEEACQPQPCQSHFLLSTPSTSSTPPSTPSTGYPKNLHLRRSSPTLESRRMT